MLHSHYDKTRVARYFARAAHSYTQHDGLQRQIAELLLAKLQPTRGVLLDVGCGPAHHAPALRGTAGQYIGLDIAPTMLEVAQQSQPGDWLLADMERLPLTNESVACLYSNLAMQWANDNAVLLREWHRVLAANGQLLASTVLAGSMWPLNECFAEVDGAVRHNRWLTAEVLQQHLELLPWQASCVVLQVTQAYPSVTAMLRDLKGIGANYTARAQASYLGRQRLAQLEQVMEQYRNDTGMLPLRWQIGLVRAQRTA